MSRQVFINYDLSNTFFSFFSRSILARTCNDTVWHHQQTIIRGIDDTTCTVKMFIFLYMFDRKGGSSSIYSPCFETTFTCRLPPHCTSSLKSYILRLFLATNNIYLLASQVTKDRLRVRKTKRKLNEILLKILYYNEWWMIYWATV